MSIGSVRLVVHVATVDIVQRLDGPATGTLSWRPTRTLKFGFAGGLSDADIRRRLRDADGTIGRRLMDSQGT